jgi:hypothetical protein
VTHRFQLRILLGATTLLCALSACESKGSGKASEGDGDNPFDNAGSAGTRAEAGSGSRSSGSSAGGMGGGSTAAPSTDAGGVGEPDAGGSGAGQSPPDAGSQSSDSGARDGGVAPGGPMGTQPIGALCAYDSHCTQAMGEAVCCGSSCELVQDCPDSPGYLPCSKGSDCESFGGSKVCCEVGPQRFCTKQSACNGRILP